MPQFITPVPKHVLVKDLDNVNELVTGASNLVAPSNDSYDQLQYGEVVAVNAHDHADLPWQPKDVVLYQKMAAHNVVFKGKQYRLVPVKYIHGKVENNG